jgi:hypothetical protein
VLLLTAVDVIERAGLRELRESGGDLPTVGCARLYKNNPFFGGVDIVEIAIGGACDPGDASHVCWITVILAERRRKTIAGGPA